jgi:hypothetical protein
MPGLKKASEERVCARAEWRNMSIREILEEAYVCPLDWHKRYIPLC